MNQNEQVILIVDDDPDIGILLKLMLEFKGYSAIVVNDGGKVSETLEKENVMLIVMDMLLSGTNGVDICAVIRQDPKTKDIPILMISAHPNAKQICLDGGANDFILKPFEMKDMLSAVDSLVAKSVPNYLSSKDLENYL